MLTREQMVDALDTGSTALTVNEWVKKIALADAEDIVVCNLAFALTYAIGTDRIPFTRMTTAGPVLTAASGRILTNDEVREFVTAAYVNHDPFASVNNGVKALRTAWPTE